MSDEYNLSRTCRKKDNNNPNLLRFTVEGLARVLKTISQASAIHLHAAMVMGIQTAVNRVMVSIGNILFSLCINLRLPTLKSPPPFGESLLRFL